MSLSNISLSTILLFSAARSMIFCQDNAAITYIYKKREDPKIFSKKIKSYLNRIKKFSGIILLITGLLIVFGKLQIIGFYLIQFFPILQKLG